MIRCWGDWPAWPHTFTSLPYLPALMAMRPKLAYPDPAVVSGPKALDNHVAALREHMDAAYRRFGENARWPS